MSPPRKRPRLASPVRQGPKRNSGHSPTNSTDRDPPHPTPSPLAGQISLRSQGVKPIPSFDRTFFSLPRKRRRYNDDVFLEPYKPAALHLAGGQRKGLREPLDWRRNYGQHVREAPKSRFPLSHVTPLPAETRRVAAFIRDTPPDDIVRLWDAQLSALDDLVKGCKLAQSKWDACIPEKLPQHRASSRPLP